MAVEAGSLRAQFVERAGRLNVRVHEVPAGGVPGTLRAILHAVGATSLAVAGNVPGRDALVEAGRAAGARAVEPAELWPDRRADVGVSVARMAVAETSSLVVHSSAEDRRVELCVDVHVVVVAAADLRPSLDDAMRLVREIAAAPPSYVSLLTGPSRTADIELIPSIGVHGAREIHVLLAGAP
jgi:L-lactate utilization protein LutC